MGELFRNVIQREMEDGTYHRYNPRARRRFDAKTGAVSS
jgi:hypothetical protein